MCDDDWNTGKYVPSHHPRIMSQSHLTASRKTKQSRVHSTVISVTLYLSFSSDFPFLSTLCISVLPAYTFVHHVCAWCLHKSEEGEGARVRDSCNCHMGAGSQTWSSTKTALWIISYENSLSMFQMNTLIVCTAPCGRELTYTLTLFIPLLTEGLTV